MRASHIALLSLAASTAAPVFAAPIFHMRARSTDGGAGLSARDSRDSRSEGHKPLSHDPQTHGHSRIPVQKAVNDFIAKVTKAKSHASDIHHEARGLPDNVIDVVEREEDSEISINSRDETNDDNDFSAMLGSRDEEDLHARGLFDLIDLGVSILGDFLRRDVDPKDLVARNGVEDLVTSIISRTPSPEQQMQARDDNPSFAEIINALSSRRESDELVARDNIADFMRILNSRRDAIDDLIDSYMSHKSAREPSPEQETHARSVESDDFINSILQSRDLSRRASTEDLLRLILANRAWDDLD